MARGSLVDTSIDLILRHQAATGAYVAAPGYRAYAYSWLRDGAFIAAAMDAHGHHGSAAAFHHWVARTVERHAHKVARLEADSGAAGQGTGDPLRPVHDRYVLHTRFTVDGAEGADRWGNFQLDGYGFWLTSLSRHLEVTGKDPAPYLDAVDITRRYLDLTWDRPCYDCWEEYPTRRHVTTWSAVAGGLRHAGALLARSDLVATSERITQRLADREAPERVLLKFLPDAAAAPPSIEDTQGSAVAGHERVGRPLADDAIDGSVLLVLGHFGPFRNARETVTATVKRIEDELVVEGGVHRYLEDEYYGGGLWIVLAGALACIQAAHDPYRAGEILDWIEAQADGDGHLGEQTSAHLRSPESLQPWIDRWGPPAKPLLWSHATYLLAAEETR